MYKFTVTALYDMPEAQTFLAQEEQRCYDSFKISKRKNDWALGRYCLKTLIMKERDDLNFKDIEIAKKEDGSPEVKIKGNIESSFNVSISHSNAVGAAALSATSLIGIDLEKIEARSKAWAEFSFHPSEYDAESSDEFLTALWAKKEAVVKYLGVGLSIGMHDVRFEPEGLKFYNRALEKWAALGAKQISLDISRDYAGFVVAVAYTKN
ncbi:phosphopantetheinyl transferase [Elusimicrobium posterum]|uniref:4'-phosphopantetheinyl transferase superfamily protein n=1 Tax=Elusimicrobium posterum TaxID=3116653 RepID=UPI003C7253FB